MPFAAILDGERLISTLMSDAQWARARAVTHADEQRLLIGATHLPGFARLSATGLRHFAHRPGYAPDGTWAETSEHLALKAAIVRLVDAHGWQVDTEVPDSPARNWIADVLAERAGRRIAFEVQWSPQTADMYIERTRRYAAAGIECVWLARRPPLTNARGLHDHTWLELGEVPLFQLLAPETISAALTTAAADIDQVAQVEIITVTDMVMNGPSIYDLPAFVTGVLDNQIGMTHYFELDVYASSCRQCNRPLLQWDLHSPLTGSRQRPEEHGSILQYVRGTQHLFPPHVPLAEIAFRRTNAMPDGYKSFVCPHCGAVQPAAFEYQSWQAALQGDRVVQVRIPVTPKSDWFPKKWDLPTHSEAVYTRITSNM